MSKQFDELAKDLAKGVSRRSAITRFLAGIGATVAGVFLARGKAQAASHAQHCISHCKACYDGEEYGQCMAHSNQCANDIDCAVFTGIAVNGNLNSDQNWTCSPFIATNGTNRGCFGQPG